MSIYSNNSSNYSNSNSQHSIISTYSNNYTITKRCNIHRCRKCNPNQPILSKEEISIIKQKANQNQRRTIKVCEHNCSYCQYIKENFNDELYLNFIFALFELWWWLKEDFSFHAVNCLWWFEWANIGWSYLWKNRCVGWYSWVYVSVIICMKKLYLCYFFSWVSRSLGICGIEFFDSSNTWGIKREVHSINWFKMLSTLDIKSEEFTCKVYSTERNLHYIVLFTYIRIFNRFI